MPTIYDPNEGLKVQSFDDIKANVNTELQEAFGDDIDLNPGSGFDMLSNALSGSLLQLFELAQGAIHSRDISLATGQELDNFGEQVDTPRLEEESDDEYRVRLVQNKNEQVATIGALNREIGLVPNVDKVRVYDINTTKTNLDIERGEIICVVLPKYDSASNSLLDSLEAKKLVANAILKTRAAGIKSVSHQNNYIQVEDSNGFVVIEGFEIAQKKYVYIQAVLTAIDNLNRIELTGNLLSDIKASLQELFEGIGNNVSISDIDDGIGCFIKKLTGKSIQIAISDDNSGNNLMYDSTDYISTHDDYTVIQGIEIVYG